MPESPFIGCIVFRDIADPYFTQSAGVKHLVLYPLFTIINDAAKKIPLHV